MPTRDEAWPAGTPSWVDLAVSDPRAAADFYAALFGWEVTDPGPESGGYLIAAKGDRPAAGIGPLPTPDVPATWSTYFATDDADATAKAVLEAGGSLHMDPFDVMDAGRMCFASAPDGATFGIWQAREHIGAGIVNEPGACAWNELHAHDLETARVFYEKVFGFVYEDISTPEFTYLLFRPDADGEPVGGLGTSDILPQGAPATWLTWFSVASCDGGVAQVRELGGEVLMEPVDSQFGRMAVVTGAQGETFGLIDLETTVPGQA